MPDHPNESLWRALWTGDPPLPTHRKRKVFGRLPSSPRCRICLVPFHGIGGRIMHLLGTRTSAKNPNFCAVCDGFASTHPGGAEVPLALLFADLRGSTALAERLPPREYKEKIDSFYRVATEVLVDADAFVDRLVGDQVVGLFLPGMAGGGYSARAIQAAVAMVGAVARRTGLALGAGVHLGVAYVGTIEGSAGVERDIAAVGDAVNTTARLASSAGAGEVLVSDEAARAADLDSHALEVRQLSLKGKSQPMTVRVIPVSREGAP